MTGESRSVYQSTSFSRDDASRVSVTLRSISGMIGAGVQPWALEKMYFLVLSTAKNHAKMMDVYLSVLQVQYHREMMDGR